MSEVIFLDFLCLILLKIQYPYLKLVGEYMKDSLTIVYNIIVSLVPIANLFIVYLVYKLTRKNINPKLYLSSEILDAINQYSKQVNEELNHFNFNIKGFPDVMHDTLLWNLSVSNNGDLPATKVIVRYKIVIKKATFEYGIDQADIKNERFIDCYEISRTLEFDYIAPQSHKTVPVLYLTGIFPYADLIITSLTSKERIFIDKPLIIDTYEHPDFNVLQDSQHYRQLLGVYKH